MHKKALLVLAASIISGCAPFETSHRESYQYGENTVFHAIPRSETKTDDNSINNDTMMQTYTPAGVTQYPSYSTNNTYEQDQNTSGQYEIGGVSEDGQSYYPAGVTTEQTPPDESKPYGTTSDAGAATLALAESSEKQEQWGSTIIQLEQAASEGSPKANYLLAKHYTKGDIVIKDEARADAYLQIADQMGYSEATRVLAWNLLLSNQVAQGKTMMEKAAQNDIRAKRDLGMLYLGLYKPDLHDPISGQQYLQQAYRQGDAEAAYQLSKRIGNANSDGSSALSFAAQHGHPKALLAQAENYLRSGNTQLAKESFESSALGGNSDAMYELANNISIGKISTSNKDSEAYVWFAVAQKNGSTLAVEELKALKGVKQINEKKNPGLLDQQIQEKMASIKKWNPNAD